ncbi:MAG: ATP-binding protein [Treponema sp.]|nr:ATP-binding protein [Treponema sp.]
MKWFNDIKIRSKHFFVFAVILFAIISFVAFSVMQITGIGGDLNELINTYQVRQIYIAEAIVESYSLRVANLAKGYLVNGDAFKGIISEYQENYRETVELFTDNLMNYQHITQSDKRLSESEKQMRADAVKEIIDLFIEYMKATGRIDTAVENADVQELIQIYAEVIPMGTTLSLKLQAIRDQVFSTTKEKALEATEHTAGVLRVIYIIAVVLVCMLTIALLLTTDSINQPISALEKAAVEIANGNLAYPIRNDRKDELGVLSNSIGDMVDKISEHTKTMTIMDNLDAMICVCDLDYNLLYANKRLTSRFDMDNDYVNKKCYNVTRGKDAPCAFCQLMDLLPQKDELPNKDFEYVWDDILNVWLGGTASIIRWVDGSMVLFQASKDVSQKKQQEELLKEALETAEMASVAKSSFLATMSHEIRTPMNAILGIAEIQLQNEALVPDTREALGKIYNSGDLLLNIINDILDLSKIEAGKLELVPAEYQVASMINDTVTLNMMRIGSKPITFELSVDPNIPSTLFGDELRIKQILNNLLSNSFKYTKKGLVKLSVFVKKEIDSKDSITLVFTVSDTGLGMTEEQIGKLFDEYSRFNMKANRTTEGTGLGMSITKNLIRMMNGEISVKSEVNWGSAFTIRLPQVAVGSSVLGRELAQSLEKHQISKTKQMKGAQMIFEPMSYGKVLVVDDVESNLYVARGLMSPYGLSIETASNGFEAIDKIRDGGVYDIVFMDHMMPEMDGIEAVKKIRELGYTQPVVALTANAVVGQSEVFLENGFDGFISKPIDVRQLNAVLKKFIRDRHQPEA